MRVLPIVFCVLAACGTPAPGWYPDGSYYGNPATGLDASYDAGPVVPRPDAGQGDGGAPDASVPDAAVRDAGTPDASVPVSSDGGVPTWKERCFAGLGGTVQGPEYEQFGPTYGLTHCGGTNMQAITGVQKVVFLGDSVTVGTLPTQDKDFYRSRLANLLASRFGLAAPNALWESVNVVSQMSLLKNSGDFWSCAKYGAHLRDLTTGANQIGQCFSGVENKRTLTVMTMGGNDFANYAHDGMNGKPLAEVLTDIDTAVGLFRNALDYLKSPTNFPNGSFVVVANVYEFTDATSNQASCPNASLAGFDKPWPDGVKVYSYLNEQIFKAAIEKGVDVVMMAENFCGHGFKAGDATGPCYRGPNTPVWFDLNTCTHPNTAGHEALANFFDQVVGE